MSAKKMSWKIIIIIHNHQGYKLCKIKLNQRHFRIMTPVIAFLPIFTLCVLSSNIGSIFITVYGDCEVEVGGKLSASKNIIPSFFFEIPNKK